VAACILGKRSTKQSSGEDTIRIKHTEHRDPYWMCSADSDGCRSAFRTDVDHHSEVMPISIPI
jgi:hypothetical protein